MRPRFFLLFSFFVILFWGSNAALPDGKNTVFQSPLPNQIDVSNVGYAESAPGKFLVTGNLQNPTRETREIVVRGLLTFYDKTAPKGDVPIFVLRKDVTIILKAGEGRSVEISLINEGGMPRGALRIEPVLRVRRQRIWNY